MGLLMGGGVIKSSSNLLVGTWWYAPPVRGWLGHDGWGSLFGVISWLVVIIDLGSRWCLALAAHLKKVIRLAHCSNLLPTKQHSVDCDNHRRSRHEHSCERWLENNSFRCKGSRRKGDSNDIVPRRPKEILDHFSIRET